jgi:transcription initiation factor TFIIB
MFLPKSEMEEVARVSSSFRCSVCSNKGVKSAVITDPESGEIICSNCGMVISQNIEDNSRPEWRSFGGGGGGGVEGYNSRTRTGMPTSLARHDKGLTTIIGRTDRDASGNKIDASIRSKMERLKTWDFRSQAHDSTNRNLIQAFNELDKLKDKLGLSDAVIERTAYIYRKARQRRLVRGRTIDAILSAAIYIACRDLGVPKTLKEVAAASSIRLKTLSRSYRVLVTELDISTPPVIDPMKCIVKVANNADLNENTKRQAMDIMNDLTKWEISSGKNPMGFAATVLYVSCLNTGVNIRQADIASAAGITEVTLRNRIKDLKDKLPQLTN